MYFRFKKFDARLFSEIEELLRHHSDEMATLRSRSIEGLEEQEERKMVAMFQSFESVLGPVGAAKALHLLAPHLFPLWDRAIARAHGGALGKTGTYGERYWEFMRSTQEQCRKLRGAGWKSGNLLKALDEYNYCKYSKGWL
jgi:hypothetical protein